MRNFFVGPATENAAEDLAFARREGTPCYLIAVLFRGGDAGGLSLDLVRTPHDLADLLDQELGPLMLKKTPRPPPSQPPATLELADPRRYNQHFAGKSFRSRQVQKRPALLDAKIDIQQHNIHWPRLHNLQPLADGGSFSDDFDIGLGRQQACNRFTKQGVIVDQHDLRRVRHWHFPEPLRWEAQLQSNTPRAVAYAAARRRRSV